MKTALLPALISISIAWNATISTTNAGDSAPNRPAKIRVLFLGDSGKNHQPSLRFKELRQQLVSRGVELSYTEALSDLSPNNLSRFDTVLLYADIDSIKRVNAEALLSFVCEGGGFVALHCASYCFRNAPEFVRLLGAQFKEHGTGVIRTDVANRDHPLMVGFGGFESWDETYIHQFHNENNRAVLEYRATESGREPWTWIRREGQGRVFYTAWGHDAVTWANPGFLNLVERGIRWTSGRNPVDAGEYLGDTKFPIPALKEMRTDLKPFEFADANGKVPTYVATNENRLQGPSQSLMQMPLEAKESLKHLVVPAGFHVELFAADPDIQGKPICMDWDTEGRLWVAETVDYPNDFHVDGSGNDRIRICEDTDGDGAADRFPPTPTQAADKPCSAES